MKTLTQQERLNGHAPDIGGSAGKGTHGGGIERPKDMPTKASADAVVGSKKEFVNAIKRDGATVYIDESFKCNIQKPIPAGDNVTLVSGYCDPNRTENDGDGPTVHFDYFTENAIKTRNSLTLYGVCFRGPTGDYFDPRDRAEKKDNVDSADAYYAAGVWCYPDEGKGEFKAIGSKFYDWPHAAIKLGSKENETTALVSRCTFTDCTMETLGYGIQQYDGALTVERCDFDRCRHAICGFGYETETLVLAESVFGPGPWAGHVVDRHSLSNNLPNNNSGLAGGWTRIWRCTAMSHKPGASIQDISGYEQEFFAIRGASKQESYIDKVDFWHDSIPDPCGDQGDAIRQETELLDGDGSEWVNLDIRDNATGGNNGPKYGAPRASTEKPGKGNGEKPKPDKPKKPSKPTKYDKLRVVGYGKSPTSYRLVINGDAKKVSGMEGNDHVRSQKGNKTVISGVVIGAIDTFGVETGAEIEEAWVAGTARVERNGTELNLVGATTRAVQQRIKTLTERVNKLEST